MKRMNFEGILWTILGSAKQLRFLTVDNPTAVVGFGFTRVVKKCLSIGDFQGIGAAGLVVEGALAQPQVFVLQLGESDAVLTGKGCKVGDRLGDGDGILGRDVGIEVLAAQDKAIATRVRKDKLRRKDAEHPSERSRSDR